MSGPKGCNFPEHPTPALPDVPALNQRFILKAGGRLHRYNEWSMRYLKTSTITLILAGWATLFGPANIEAKELVVKKDQANLLSNCSEGASRVARLPEGLKVRLRFAIAGSDSPCYSVSAELDGRSVRGYVSKDALEGIEAFEQTRRDAASGSFSSGQVTSGEIEVLGLPPSVELSATSSESGSPAMQAKIREAVDLLKKGDPAAAEKVLLSAGAPPGHAQVALLHGQALLRISRPDKAFKVAEAALKTHPDSADLLALAGISLYRRDEVAGAGRYLKRSIEIRPNPGIERFYRKIAMELAGDKSDDVTHGTSFILRYEGETLQPAAARQFSAVLEREINRISYQLGCQSSERFVVIIQSIENYRSTTGAAEWSGGQFDGKISIALPAHGQVDEHVRKTLSHEFVHACLARLGPWPAWLHEGLAQSFSGRELSRDDWANLRLVKKQSTLPTLARLSGGWSRLDSMQASLAYKLGLAAIEILRRDPLAVRALLSNPRRLPAVTEKLDQKLKDELD